MHMEVCAYVCIRTLNLEKQHNTLCNLIKTKTFRKLDRWNAFNSMPIIVKKAELYEASIIQVV